MAEETYVWMTEIPHDMILLHILPKLPTKAIARFRSVCKQWNSFLKSPVFYDLYHHHVTNSEHRYDYKLLVLSRTRPFKFFSVDCEAPEEVLSLNPPFEIGDHYVFILTSCNGLICLGMKKKWNDACYVNLILWNPVSSEYKTLSKINSQTHYYYYGDEYDNFEMYYDSSEDDYKILRLTRFGNVYIYSLKSDSWGQIVISVTPQSTKIYYTSIPSVVLDEKIYFLTKVHGDTCITRFDTKTEKLTKITTLYDKQRSNDQTIFVEKSSLHLCVRDHTDTEKRFEVFMMNEDGEWTSMKTYSPKRCLHARMRPLHFMRNGNRLMHYNGDLYDVDMEKLNSSDNFDPLNKKAFDITGKGKYMETFVSPNCYM